MHGGAQSEDKEGRTKTRMRTTSKPGAKREKGDVVVVAWDGVGCFKEREMGALEGGGGVGVGASAM